MIKQNKTLSSPITVNGTQYSQVESALGGLASAVNKTTLLDLFYPVGSIYQSTDGSFNPNTRWGGTWVNIEGRFLLGASSYYAMGWTGGEADHTLTLQEMPKHNHSYWETTDIGSGVPNFYASGDAPMYLESTATSDTGGNVAHNNMPPYLVVAIWKRTA